MKRQIEEKVRRRCRGLCEYCRAPEAASPLRFPIDHVVARQHRGSGKLDNLALACGFCNRHKGPNLAGIDPQTSQMFRLYHPRRDRWSDHFQWRGAHIIGKTSIGRVTVVVLAMNNPQQLAIREALIREGVFRS